jgi:hypothetical protein
MNYNASNKKRYNAIPACGRYIANMWQVLSIDRLVERFPGDFRV